MPPCIFPFLSLLRRDTVLFRRNVAVDVRGWFKSKSWSAPDETVVNRYLSEWTRDRATVRDALMDSVSNQAMSCEARMYKPHEVNSKSEVTNSLQRNSPVS
jgi:hypothetical protein